MSRTIGLGLVAVALVGCGPSYRKLKVDKIQSLSVAIDDAEQTFCAYAPTPLRALVTYKNGDQARTRAPGEASKGLLRTSEFEWSSNHGTVDTQAVLSLPHDALGWFDEPIAVNARVIARPELVGEGVVRPRFDCGGTLDLRGSVGARGGEAEDGGPGAPGPIVDVALGYIDTQRSGRLVLVRVRSGDEPAEHYLVDADSAREPFVIDAGGGDGGRGGQGMAGVTGRAGVDGQDPPQGATCATATPGQPGTTGGPGSPGGPGRDAGPGGPGGHVVVRYDARFPELPSLIEIRVEGGAGGEAGLGGFGGFGGRGGVGGAGCPAADGTAGARGTDAGAGTSGPQGPEGLAGSAGPRGEVGQSPGEVLELFAEELARGLPIVTGASS